MMPYQLVIHTIEEDALHCTCKNAHWIVDGSGVTNVIEESQETKHTVNDTYNSSTIGMGIQGDNICEKVYLNAVKTAAEILTRNGWNINRMIQHSDVMNCETCKCPNSLVLNWRQFRLDVIEQLRNLSY
ncbi:N-acetylmuramoyl-L-alanine amidase [Brevibacillus fortis]|uniref:N-acetylmuramoyl-L-alanine amidase n=1 Tax=Brevibacillus fortis TaxID=2126352 RepID=UPI0038FCB389